MPFPYPTRRVGSGGRLRACEAREETSSRGAASFFQHLEGNVCVCNILKVLRLKVHPHKNLTNEGVGLYDGNLCRNLCRLAELRLRSER